VLLAAVLFPAFSFLDYYSAREAFFPLTIIRFATTAVFILLFIASKKSGFPRRAVPAAFFILAVASASITLMCIVRGGYGSRYYAGVNLVILAAGLVFPWSHKTMAAAAGMIFAIYSISVLVYAGFEIQFPELLLNNFYFLAATGIISIASAHHSFRLRRVSFKRLMDIENAQAARRKFFSS
jgi:hypothetical protein